MKMSGDAASPEHPADRVGDLIKDLGALNDTKVRLAKQRLLNSGGRAIPALCEAMKSSNHHVRRRAAAVAGGIRQRYAYLRETAPKDSPPDTSEAAEIWACMPQLIRALCDLAKDPAPDVRTRVFDALDFGALDRIPIETLPIYLAANKGLNHWAYCAAMAAALTTEEGPAANIAVAEWPALAASYKSEIIASILGVDGPRGIVSLLDRLGTPDSVRREILDWTRSAATEHDRNLGRHVTRLIEGLAPDAPIEGLPTLLLDFSLGGTRPGKALIAPMERRKARRVALALALASVLIFSGPAMVLKFANLERGLDWGSVDFWILALMMGGLTAALMISAAGLILLESRND